MSNRRKHIDRFLQDKLKDHSLPVGEMEWDLLEKRRNKKPRRKFGLFILLFLCSATLAWFAVNWEKGGNSELLSNESSQNSETKESKIEEKIGEEPALSENIISETQPKVQDQKAKEPKDQKLGEGTKRKTGTPENNAVANENSEMKNTAQTKGENLENSPSGGKNGKQEKLRKGDNERFTGNRSKNEIRTDADDGSISGLANEGIEGKKQIHQIEAKPYFFAGNFFMPTQVFMEQKEQTITEDTLVKTPKFSSKDIRSFGLFTWHLSIAYNTLKGTTVSDATEATGAHRSYEKNVKESAEPITSYNFNGGISRALFKGFRANISAQYTHISQNYSYNFIRNEIPFFDTNDVILAYFIVPDSSAEPVNATTKNTHQVINIPLAFNYTFPVSNKVRLGAGIFGSLGYDFIEQTGTLDEKTLEWTFEVQKSKRLNYQYGVALSGQYLFKYGMGVEISFKYGRNSSLYSPDKNYTANPQLMGLELRLIKDF